MPNIYSVFAHPNKTSSTSSINSLMEDIARNKGYRVTSTNLYELGFDPILSSSDMIGFRKNRINSEIKDEQDLILESDIIILGYPVWWAGMPAILKGWIDRVFAYNFAYKVTDGVPIGLLTNKKAIIINTHGQPTEDYHNSGMFKAMNVVSDIGIFDFCGIEVIEHLYYEDSSYDTDARSKLFDEIERDLIQAIPDPKEFEKNTSSIS